MSLKINIGCGNDYRKSTEKIKWINIDIQPPCDVLLNIEHDKFPYKDNSIDYITCERTLTHLTDITHFMKECYRVLKKGGILHITTMYFRHPIAFNPSHKLFFNLYSMDSWCGGSRTMTYPVKFKKEGFRFVNIPNKFAAWVAKKNKYIYQNILAVFFPCMEIEWELEKT